HQRAAVEVGRPARRGACSNLPGAAIDLRRAGDRLREVQGLPMRRQDRRGTLWGSVGLESPKLILAAEERPALAQLGAQPASADGVGAWGAWAPGKPSVIPVQHGRGLEVQVREARWRRSTAGMRNSSAAWKGSATAGERVVREPGQAKSRAV